MFLGSVRSELLEHPTGFPYLYGQVIVLKLGDLYNIYRLSKRFVFFPLYSSFLPFVLLFPTPFYLAIYMFTRKKGPVLIGFRGFL